MLGLETDEGQSAEVEIDAADQEELMPEGQCRPMGSGAGGWGRGGGGRRRSARWGEE